MMTGVFPNNGVKKKDSLPNLVENFIYLKGVQVFYTG